MTKVNFYDEADDALLKFAVIIARNDGRWRNNRMIYTVKRIDEDIDFGCEERSEDSLIKAVVTLADADGQECRMKMEDALLYERGISEGDKVYFDEKNKLEKAPDDACDNE